jgi:serine/threonine protein phosphatase PrpC
VVFGRIIKDNKRIHISRAFGDHLYKSNSSLPPKEQMIIAWSDVVVEQLKPNKDEFMVIMFDGVWNCISNEELISFVAKTIKTSEKLSKICEQLFARLPPQFMPTKGIVGKDNMTFVIVKFKLNNQKKICSKETISTGLDPSQDRESNEKSP